MRKFIFVLLLFPLLSFSQIDSTKLIRKNVAIEQYKCDSYLRYKKGNDLKVTGIIGFITGMVGGYLYTRTYRDAKYLTLGTAGGAVTMFVCLRKSKKWSY